MSTLVAAVIILIGAIVAFGTKSRLLAALVTIATVLFLLAAVRIHIHV